MPRPTVFILSASADIGCALAGLYAADGWTVVGTYRQREGARPLDAQPDVHLLPCDVARPESIDAMVRDYRALDRPWDVFVSAVGLLDPIGPWASLDFDAWEQSVMVNSTAQLRALHRLYPERRLGAAVHAAFFAGGGTNGTFTNYSAYCVSKILLIKMCELLDDELPDLNAFIVGPGFLPTKINRSTLEHPEAAGDNYRKTLEFYRTVDRAATYRDVYDCLHWCVAQGRAVVGGRNIALVHDGWREGGRLASELRSDRHKFKLRRAGNTMPAHQGDV